MELFTVAAAGRVQPAAHSGSHEVQRQAPQQTGQVMTPAPSAIVPPFRFMHIVTLISGTVCL